MKIIRLVIPDLFLPHDIARRVCSGLRLPALEKLLARGTLTGADSLDDSNPSTSSGRTGLESYLCDLFGQPHSSDARDAPIAAISARFDGLGEGCWLRADPVHLHLDQSRMLLSAVSPTGEEGAALCASLNEHFAGQGMEFFAPHPQRWYVRLDALPRIRTTPLAQVIGGDVRGAMPEGEDAVRWHGIFNEMQMLLYSHPVNDAREGRGELPVNSVWLWGGGCTADIALQRNFDFVSSDEVLPEMFAAATSIPFAAWETQWREAQGRQLLVWTGLRSAMQRGDLAGWRAALQDLEAGYAQPLWQALREGRIARLEIDVPGDDGVRQVCLTRGSTWAFWRRPMPLDSYSLV
jgi:hypothetical protein